MREGITWERYLECWQAFVEMERKYEEALLQHAEYRRQLIDAHIAMSARKVPEVMTREERDTKIRRLAACGIPKGEIARKFDMQVRAVSLLLRCDEPAPALRLM